MISKICFENHQNCLCDYDGLYTNEFRAVRHLKLSDKTTKMMINILGVTFPQLEKLELNSTFVRNSLYDVILKHCGNLKRLHLDDVRYDNYNNRIWYRHIDSGSWITKEYPKLEYLEMRPISSIVDLNTLLENNPNIYCFSTDAKSIWYNYNAFLNSNIQLDLLVITSFDNIQKMNFEAPFCDLLNELYAKGFYKRIHLINILSIYNENFNLTLALASLNGLEKLDIRCSISCNIIGVSNKYFINLFNQFL